MLIPRCAVWAQGSFRGLLAAAVIALALQMPSGSHGGDKSVGVPIARGERPWLVTDSGGHSAPVRAAFFHPNGDNLVTVSADKTVRLWDLGSGEMMHVFRLPVGPGIQGALQAGDISPDGRWLAVGGATVGNGKFGELVYLINIESNQVEKTMPGHEDFIVHLAFSHDGATLASASKDGTARLYDPKTGQTLRVLKGHTHPLRRLAFSHDDKYVATTDVDRTVRIWSAADGQTVTVLKDYPKDVITVAWHPKEHLLATSCVDGTIQIWKTDGTRLKNVKVDPADTIQVVAMAFSPDGNELLYGGVSYSGRVGMFNLKDDKIRVAFTKHTNTVLDARFSPDGKLVITTGGDNHETYVWKPTDGSVVQKLQGASQSVWSVGWRLDGKAFGWGHTNGAKESPLEHSFVIDEMQFGPKPDKNFGQLVTRLNPWSIQRLDILFTAVLKDGKELYKHSAPRQGDRVYGMSLVPGGRAIVGSAFQLYLLDLETNKVLRNYRGHNGIVIAVSPSPDGKYFLSGSLDQTISLWDLEREEPLATFFAVGREWIAWTPQGYYACSAYGERLMGWQINNGPDKLGSFHPAARFRSSLYQPNLVRLILQEKSLEKAMVLASEAGSDPISVSVAQVLPPAVALLSPAGADCVTKETSIEVKARAKSIGEHPITGMRLLVDGRPHLGDKGLRKFDPPRKGEVEASWTVELLPGKHSVAVVAESSVSKGVSSWTEVTRKGVKTEELPNLYVVAAGVSAYPGRLALNFAHKDAIVLAKTLQAHHDGVFRKVESKLMTDRLATRKNVLDGLAWLEKSMTSKDVAILFLAGHGSRDERGQFHFLPVDADQEDMDKSCVSGALLKKKLANLPGRVVILLDACHSGAASNKKKPVTDDLVRDLVSDDVGIVAMCSSQGAEYSMESKDVEHGFFTLGLVEALTGRADYNKDGYVYLHEIDYYTYHRVRQLSDGGQHPTTGRPQHMRSFPLAKVKN